MQLFLFSVFLNLFAAPWAVVANTPDVLDPDPYAPGTIHTIDLGQNPPKVYGPHLGGKLGSAGGGLFDVAVLPGQRFAVISNFGDSKLFFIDLKDPKNPVQKAMVQIPFFAEDIAISPNGSLALITDGGFSSKVAVVDLKTFTLKKSVDTGLKQAQAVAIGPDNTVLLADYWNCAVHYGAISPTGDSLTDLKTICLCDGTLLDEDNCSTCRVDGLPTTHQARAVNVEISPNGKTALVSSAVPPFVNVLKINGPGDVVRGEPFFLKGFDGDWDNTSTTENEERGGIQNVQFQSDAKAYALRQPRDSAGAEIFPNELREILITGPGKAEVSVRAPIKLLNHGSSQLFGVDTMGIAGGQALVGNPTLSLGDNAYIYYVAYVNLVTGVTTPVQLNSSSIATGVSIKLW